jgi:hypothetical protein
MAMPFDACKWRRQLTECRAVATVGVFSLRTVMSPSFAKLLPRSYWVLLVLMTTLITACASAPVQEMSDARQALDAALRAGAAERAPTQTQAAQSSLAEAEKSLKRREFSHARQNAQQARSQAIEAQRIAQSATSSNPAP